MQMEKCRHGEEAPSEMLRALPKSQGGLGRHKCPSCAYQQGMAESSALVLSLGRLEECGHGAVAPKSILESLGDSQGGSGRHKCVVCAYQRGRAAALDVMIDSAWANYVKSGRIENLLFQEDFSSHDVSYIPEVDNQGSVAVLDARAQEIGLQGEILVIEHEKRRLVSEGLLRLANQVVHVAVEEGDGAGYDIRSFDSEGKPMFIEVKTSVSGKLTPFFITRNELEFARTHSADYFLYRLYELDEVRNSAKFFIRRGDPVEYFELSPRLYAARPVSGGIKEK